MISSSAWRLFRANALCLIRRLQPVARTNPLLASLAVLAPGALLVGSAWADSRGAAAQAAVLSDGASSDGASAGVVLPVAVVFAIVGFNVQHVYSAGRFLDDQIRSAPLSRLELFLGTVGIPFTALCLVLSIMSLIFFVPLSFAVGTLPYAPFYLVLFEVATFYATGAVGEAMIRASATRGAARCAAVGSVLGGSRRLDRRRSVAGHRSTTRTRDPEHRGARRAWSCRWRWCSCPSSA